MGDAFSPKQCSLSYLKSQVIHLHHLKPQMVYDGMYAVLRLYEGELLARGLKVISTPGGEVTFQPVSRRNVYLDRIEVESSRNKEAKGCP